MLEKLKTDRPEILATCRYECCQKRHEERHNNSILQWKATICQQDIDYKGYYSLICTEKCCIDFHPWCWQHKKKQDGKKGDKDYLQVTMYQHIFSQENCETWDTLPGHFSPGSLSEGCNSTPRFLKKT